MPLYKLRYTKDSYLTRLIEGDGMIWTLLLSSRVGLRKVIVCEIAQTSRL
jgi:hypothetical protein